MLERYTFALRLLVMSGTDIFYRLARQLLLHNSGLLMPNVKQYKTATAVTTVRRLLGGRPKELGPRNETRPLMSASNSTNLKSKTGRRKLM